jgi:hypothetical protein
MAMKVCGQPRTANVWKVLPRSVRTQLVLDTVAFLKKNCDEKITISHAPKVDKFVKRKRDSKKCESNINQKLVCAGLSQIRFLKIRVFILLYYIF